MSFKLRLRRVKYSARAGFSPSHSTDLTQSPSSNNAFRCLSGFGNVKALFFDETRNGSAGGGEEKVAARVKKTY